MGTNPTEPYIAFQPQAAELAWQRTVDFLDKHLL